MANNKEEAGKGTPRPGEMSSAQRPYATIDLSATEIGPKGSPPSGAGAAKPPTGAASAADAKAAAKAEPTKAGEPPAKASASSDASSGAGGAKKAGSPSGLFSLRERGGAGGFLTHAAAGAIGALLAIFAWQLFGPDQTPAPNPDVNALLRRMADVESALGTRPEAGLRARVNEINRSLTALGEAQAKLARESRALEGKIGSGPEVPPELAARITKLEEMLAAMSTADQGSASPHAAALANRLAELQKAMRDVGESAKTGLSHFEAELSAIRTEGGRLVQRLDGLRGEVDERMQGAAKAADLRPLSGKIAALEQELQSFLKTETDRSANASRVVLTLELADLKRAIDRGEGFTEELARVKRAGGNLNLAPLERYMREGVPTPGELNKSFRPAANAMLDAEAERADAGVVDRLISGARSIVRVRKSGHAPDDTSVEAVVGRMDTALKDGRLADVLANAKKLPPKAALAGEDWVRKVQARQAAEQALADVEVSLKASLAPTAGTRK
jgi:hypothetical protein